MTKTGSTMFSSVALFSGLAPQQLHLLEAKAIGPSTYRAGELIVAEGGRPDMLYVIESGRVKAFSTSRDGDEVIFGVLGPGDFFGELAVLDKRSRAASVQALTDTMTWQLRRTDFDDFCHANPQVYSGIVKALVQCIRTLDEQIEQFALLDVRERVITKLGGLAAEREGQRVIDYRFTHEEIASMVGSSRERVSQVMKHLRAEKVISVTRDSIVFLGAGNG